MSYSIDDTIAPTTASGHVPVLLRETLELFGPSRGFKLLDGTFGGGGHTRAFLEAAENVTVVALDRDPAAIVRAKALIVEFGDRFRLYHSNFGDLADLDERGFHGILFDFGLSSFQLDTKERGFSFRYDAPVDMRMNPEVGISAAEFLETADEAALVRAVRTTVKSHVCAGWSKRSSMRRYWRLQRLVVGRINQRGSWPHTSRP